MTSWLQVESSNLAAFRYDAATETLDVAFKRGVVYRYFGVPGQVAQGLAGAESKGSYFHQFVRTSYRYEKLDETYAEGGAGDGDEAQGA